MKIGIPVIQRCDCKDWEENIKKVDAGFVFLATHFNSKGYDGKPFKFCPWCAKELTPERSNRDAD